METQHIPAYISMDAKGNTYARVAPTQFPASAEGNAPLIHRITAYSKAALWNGVEAWFHGGQEVSGRIDPAAATIHTFESKGGATWRIYPPGRERDDRMPLAWSSFATPVALDSTTYGYRWAKDLVSSHGATITLPEYYRLTKDKNDKEQWQVVNAKDVPAETGLAQVVFSRARKTARQPYLTPDEPDSLWKTPGPTAGPFEVKLGDGSTVTYYWYRFADQPAIRYWNMTSEDRDALQTRVELLHRHWHHDREYLPEPTVGQLANLDPALLVDPPPGLEIGYVPIATRQELR
jgi:hypothetical protein